MPRCRSISRTFFTCDLPLALVHYRGIAMRRSRENPQHSEADQSIPWEGFLDWLVAGLIQLEILSHKSIKRAGRGWRQDARRKIERQTEYLIGRGMLEPEVRGNPFFSPEPYLAKAKRNGKTKLLAAYRVAKCRLGHRPDCFLAGKLRVTCEVIRRRVFEAHKMEKKSGISEIAAIEWEFCWFKFNDRMKGGRLTRNLPQARYAPFDPAQALSERERSEIAELCDAAKCRPEAGHARSPSCTT